MAGKTPELLCPAGDMERLEMALCYGADAVYLSGTRFGMRAASGFSEEALRRAATMCREKGVKLYAACNAVLHGQDVRALPPFLEFLQEVGADAVIVADLGALALAKKHAPRLQIHVSTQAGVANDACARAFYDMGATRVILARELTLDEIADIRANTPPDLALEAFVHGSMCVSFSGRCLISNYLTGRDANQGACAQPCRWKYHLVEEKRPGELFEITEDNGTFILNSRDLCMIEHIPALLDAGIDSLKIEGRMKSAYYAAVVTNAYRHALDATVRGEAPERLWLDEVQNVSHRPYETGFYFKADGPGQYYENAMYFSGCDVVAVVESCDASQNAVLTQRNRFFKGDTLELLMPDVPPVSFVAEALYDTDGMELDAAPHPMMVFTMRLPAVAPRCAIIRKRRQKTPDGP
ncbi:U32 family peptidase [Oscillospiraceae bacterium CM]|nr:U32 family peptidase [Oscillospiraceae bacterium CM]